MNTSISQTAHVQMGETPDEYGFQPPEDPYRVRGETLTISVGENGTQAQSSPGVSHLDMSTVGNGRSDIFSTALNSAGSPTSNINDKATIEVEGMRVDLPTAARLGYVHRDAQGNYSEVQQSPKLNASTLDASASEEAKSAVKEVTKEATKGAAKDAPQAALSPDFGPAEAAFAEAIAPVPQAIYDRTLLDVANKGMEAVDLNAIAEASGMSIEQAQSSHDAVYTMFQNHVDSAVKTTGMDPQAVYQWAEQNYPKEHKAAVHEYLVTRNTSRFVEFANQYARSVDVPDSTLNEAGYPTMIDPTTKQRMVRIGNCWTSVKAAVVGGLI